MNTCGNEMLNNLAVMLLGEETDDLIRNLFTNAGDQYMDMISQVFSACFAQGIQCVESFGDGIGNF